MNNIYSYEKKKCELLAPAGSKEAFVAAVEAGADAVYVGGNAFNARANADNFSLEELKKAVSFAHKRRVKVYVTVNILIRDDELLDALEYCRNLSNIGVDAIIVQDLGLGSLVREFLPELPIHMSTQGSVYNLDGVKAAADLGYERVVTARELSYEEIKDICQNTDTEIEIFVHGAQCICYSGQCQLSRFNGGRSGNRGKCAQPCRLAYTGFKDGKEYEFAHLLSPSDLCLIDNLDKIIDCGVASLKIEGRMKSPEYVAIVISIYRKYIDQYYNTGKVEVSEEDREALLQIFNRGSFTEAYFEGQSDKEFMSKQVPKNRGIEIGKVIDDQSGRNIIEVKTSEPVKQGDGIEIRGKGFASNIATFVQQTSGNAYRIGDFKTKVYKGDVVFRTTSKEQMDYAARFYKNKTWDQGKYEVKVPIDIYLNLEDSGVLTATAVEVFGDFDKTVSAQAELSGLELAEEEMNLCARAVDSFRKSGGTPFEVREVYTDQALESCKFKLTMSSMNKLRRKLLGRLEAMLEKVDRKIVDQAWLKEQVSAKLKTLNNDLINNSDNRDNSDALELYFLTWEGYEKVAKNQELQDLIQTSGAAVRYVVPACECLRHDADDEFVVPYITNISKGKEDEFLKAHIDELVKLAAKNGVYVGNLGWVEVLTNSGVAVYGDYGLNAYNEATLEVLGNMGVCRAVWSLEAEEEGKPIPVMITEQPLAYDKLVDRRGLELGVVEREFSSQRIIVPVADSVGLVKQAIKSGVRKRLYL